MYGINYQLIVYMLIQCRPTVNVFNNRIDKYIVKAGYT